MTAASGLAQTFWQLAAARVLVAIGESTLTPASIAMLGDAFPPKQRSLAAQWYGDGRFAALRPSSGPQDEGLERESQAPESGASDGPR